MMRKSTRPRNFFRKLVVNGVSNSKAAIQNDCLMRLYDADSELKAISSELDSFDGKKDPIRCNLLVNQLRTAQDKVISLLFQLMDDCNCDRASRDYRMKFPDEILLSEGSESLNGQIWFGAECLSAGSNILNHTKESTMLRPMAKTLTQHLDSLRNDLRDLVVDGGGAARINTFLINKMVAFDHIFATFEYEYVRTMLPIRTVVEIEKLQEVAVLFSETLIDCVKRGLIKQDDIDEFQPIVMIAIPRLAIVRGLLYKNENPIYTRHKSHMCSLFQPFHGPLHSIRKLLRGLSQQDLFTLERMLANDQSMGESLSDTKPTLAQVMAPSRGDELVKEKAASESAQQQNYFQPNDLDQSSQASTSNTYTNVLMDGLQYPVGQKLNPDEVGGITPPETMESDPKRYNSDNDNGQQLNCYLEVQASSSKVLLEEERNLQQGQLNANSPPTGSSTLSPSSSVSSQVGQQPSTEQIERKFEKNDNNDSQSLEERHTQNNECDNQDCCLSPPESDAQLEKLIASFSPSVNDDDNSNNSSNNSQPLPETSSRQQSGELQATTTSSETVSNTECETLLPAFDDAQYTENVDQKSTATNSSDGQIVAGQDSTNTTTSRRERKNSKVRSKAGDASRLDDLFQKQTKQLLHRLFVAISGVADQLQSNFASDLRFILRHIFSSEIDGDEEEEVDENVGEIYDEDDEEEDEEEDYSNQENSDSSLPIEQGVEAREANLIDFDSSYTVMDTVYPARAQAEARPLSNQSSTTYGYNDQRHPTASSVATVTITASTTHLHPHPNESFVSNQRPFQASLEQQQQQTSGQRLNDELIAGIIRASSEQSSEISYDSPNDPSIMDNSQHQQRLMQQHLQSVSAQASARAAAAAAVAAQQAYDQVIVGRGQVERVRDPSQRHSERRSRHHHHHSHHHSGSSRSSRHSRGSPPVWVPDQLVVQCRCCHAPFTLFRRRHHCRACGQIFCAECSRFTKNLSCWGYNSPVRVCESCFNHT